MIDPSVKSRNYNSTSHFTSEYDTVFFTKRPLPKDTCDNGTTGSGARW